MVASPASRANLRNAKRPRSSDELAALAQRLGADWKPGDKLMTWIRRHEAVGRELSQLVRDGWSWADVGRALALAGIMYDTGQAIPGYLLQRKAGKARADERKRQEDEARRRPFMTIPAPTAPVPPAVEPPTRPADQPPGGDKSAPEGPRFRPVRLRDGLPALKPQSPTQRPLYPPQAEAPEMTDEEIVRSVLGTKR